MIDARCVRPGAQSAAVPVRRPSALDGVPSVEAREILERGSLLTIGPQLVLDAGGCAASVSWDGLAFRVYGDAGEVCRGTYASWAAAHAALLDAALEWEMRVGETAEAVGI